MLTTGYIGRGAHVHLVTTEGTAACNSVRQVNRARPGSVDNVSCKKCLAALGEYQISRARAVKAPTIEAPPAQDDPHAVLIDGVWYNVDEDEQNVSEPPPVRDDVQRMADSVQATYTAQVPMVGGLPTPERTHILPNGFPASVQQLAVLDFVADADAGNLRVGACAGSGKTTILEAAAAALPPGARVLYVAFSKPIVTEASERLPGVECRTFHSLGAATLNRRMRRGKANSRKSWDILKPRLSRDDLNTYGAFVVRLVALAKAEGIGTPGYIGDRAAAAWRSLIERHDLDLPREDADLDKAILIARRTLAQSQALAVRPRKQGGPVIDFDDMLYQPIVEGLKWSKYDYVLVDEAQDTSALQGEIVSRMLAEGGRVVFVGDERQAIYGFRGADAQAFDHLAERFDCATLPLSVTYRCGASIVEAAQNIAPEISARPGAPDGTVDSLGSYSPQHFDDADLVVCRNTAPLIALAYGFVARRRGCRVLGREIGEGLQTLIRKLSSGNRDMDADTLEDKLDAWQGREQDKANAKDRPDLADRISDKAQALRIVLEHLPEHNRTAWGAFESIGSLFEDQGKGLLTLCTVHKAKGLEADRVFILDTALMPSKWAKKEWMKVQESNLEYVAITRAKSTLTYITSDTWSDTSVEGL